MPIHFPDILGQVTSGQRFSYTDKDVMLYALSIGMATDPLDERQLRFTCERDLKVVPSIVTVLGAGGNAMQAEPPGGRLSTINFTKVLHGEHKIDLFRPLPATGSFTSRSEIVGAYDKGADKGAVVLMRSVWTDDAGEEVAATTSSIFARGDGGFGGPSEGAPVPHPTPQRAPDLSLDFATQPNQALIYRLNGDRNPIHYDLGFARAAGFDRPILHGLCSYGVTCRAVIEAVLDYEPDRILSHQVRFSSPVFPGEIITVDIWRDDIDISFEARVKARGITVIKNGLTRLRE